MNILVFDSGIGGLGVVREIRLLQPRANLTYLADNGFFPYGQKPDSLLLPHIINLIGAAIDLWRPDAIVIACNTASTIALAALRAAYPEQKFIGCVPPIKPAAAASRNRSIGILATEATIRRAYLADLITDFAPDCAIHTLGTPTLAELAEQKFRGHDVDVAPAIAPLFAQQDATKIDAIALGCTHYTFLLPEFLALHPHITWHDPAAPVARQLLATTMDFPDSPPRPNAAYFTGALADIDLLRPCLAAFGFVAVCAASTAFFEKKAAKKL
jgi:glutamate racemase